MIESGAQCTAAQDKTHCQAVATHGRRVFPCSACYDSVTKTKRLELARHAEEHVAAAHGLAVHHLQRGGRERRWS